MSGKFVKNSKFRHVFGCGSKKELCYDGAMMSLDSNDYNLVNANGKFLSIHWDASGGGAFLVYPINRPGRIQPDLPLFTGHAGPVLDTAWNPFNDHVIASAGEDGKVMVWNVPEDPLAEQNEKINPAGTLKGHDRRIIDLKWHPSAENVLSSASHDMTVRIWDVEKGMEKASLQGHADAVLHQSWSLEGDLIATSCRDKRLRIFDARSSKEIDRWQGHAGVKGMRLSWLGNTPYILTTGFGRSSEREVALWDTRNSSTALHLHSVDTSSGPLLPYLDSDLKLLYLAGRGDGNIRYYEINPESSGSDIFYYLSEYKSSDPQRSLAMLPKTSLKINENEIARFIKVYGSQPMLEPISFKVPRRDNSHFSAEIYPPALSHIPAMSADEYFSGKNAQPNRIDLSTLFDSTATESNTIRKAISITNSSDEVSIAHNGPSDDYETLKKQFLQLQKENEQLRDELSQKNIKIRQLGSSSN